MQKTEIYVALVATLQLKNDAMLKGGDKEEVPDMSGNSTQELSAWL